jgi:hypothetical protein
MRLISQFIALFNYLWTKIKVLWKKYLGFDMLKIGIGPRVRILWALACRRTIPAELRTKTCFRLLTASKLTFTALH